MPRQASPAASCRSCRTLGRMNAFRSKPSLLERTLLGVAALPWLLTLLAAYLLALPVPALVRHGRDIFIQPHAVVSGIVVLVALALACFTAMGAAVTLVWQTRSRYAAASLAL